jgi:hypothetical protein
MNITFPLPIQDSINQYSSFFQAALSSNTVVTSDMPKWQAYIQKILTSQPLPENLRGDELLQKAHTIQNMFNQPKISGNKLNRETLLKWRSQATEILKEKLENLKTFNACNRVLTLVQPYQKEAFLKALSLETKKFVESGVDTRSAFSRALAYVMSRSMIEPDSIVDCDELVPYTCPISGKVAFSDSCYLAKRVGKDGKPIERYTRSSLENWIQSRNGSATDPHTRERITFHNIRSDLSAEKEAQEIICNYLYPGVKEASQIPLIGSSDPSDSLFFAGLLGYFIVKEFCDASKVISIQLDSIDAQMWISRAIDLFSPYLSEMDSSNLVNFKWKFEEDKGNPNQTQESLQYAQAYASEYLCRTPTNEDIVPLPQDWEGSIRIMQKFLKDEISNSLNSSSSSSTKNVSASLEEKLSDKLTKYREFFKILSDSDFSLDEKKILLNRAIDLILKADYVGHSIRSTRARTRSISSSSASQKSDSPFTFEDLMKEVSVRCKVKSSNIDRDLLEFNQSFLGVSSSESRLTPKQEFLRSFYQNVCQFAGPSYNPKTQLEQITVDMKIWQEYLEDILNCRGISRKGGGLFFEEAQSLESMYNRPELSTAPMNPLTKSELRKEMRELIQIKVNNMRSIAARNELLSLLDYSPSRSLLADLSAKEEELHSQGLPPENAASAALAYIISKQLDSGSLSSSRTSSLSSSHEVSSAKRSSAKRPRLHGPSEGQYLSAILGYSIVKEMYLNEVEIEINHPRNVFSFLAKEPEDEILEGKDAILEKARKWEEFCIELFAPCFEGQDLTECINHLSPKQKITERPWTDAQPLSFDFIYSSNSLGFVPESSWKNKIKFMKAFLEARIKTDENCRRVSEEIRSEFIQKMDVFLTYSRDLSDLDLDQGIMERFQDSGIEVLLGTFSQKNLDYLDRDEYSVDSEEEEAVVGSKRSASSSSAPKDTVTLESLLQKAVQGSFTLGKKAKKRHLRPDPTRELIGTMFNT